MISKSSGDCNLRNSTCTWSSCEESQNVCRRSINSEVLSRTLEYIVDKDKRIIVDISSFVYIVICRSCSITLNFKGKFSSCDTSKCKGNIIKYYILIFSLIWIKSSTECSTIKSRSRFKTNWTNFTVRWSSEEDSITNNIVITTHDCRSSTNGICCTHRTKIVSLDLQDIGACRTNRLN